MQREIISEIVIEIVLIRVMNGDWCRYIVVDLKYNLDYQISQVDYSKAYLSIYHLKKVHSHEFYAAKIMQLKQRFLFAR